MESEVTVAGAAVAVAVAAAEESCTPNVKPESAAAASAGFSCTLQHNTTQHNTAHATHT